MDVPIPKEKWSGKMGEIKLGAETGEGGSRRKNTVAGGQTGLPFLSFENEYPNRPLLAGEVVDSLKEYPEIARDACGDAVNDPVVWAKMWVEDFGADLICLRLMSTNPEEENTSSEEAAQLVRRILDEVPVPAYAK